MKLIRKMFVLSAIAFVLCVSVTAVYADTHAAVSCSLVNINSAIAAASSGDIVTVPAGTCTWNSGIDVTKALTITGTGIGSTIIKAGYFNYTPTAGEASKTFELSGFTFDANNGSNPCFNAGPPNATTPITGLKIHNNAFINANVRAVNLGGLEFGVFYNNQFSNNYISVSVIGAGNAGWNYPHAFGSANYPYFEDNTFANGKGAFISETGQGGRLAFRHNTITGYACSGCEVHDIHGDQGDRGSVSSEYYHNTVNVGTSGTYRWVHHRGGQGIFANNTVNRNISFQFTEYKSWGGNGYCESYPAKDQINNSFYFNNSLSGSVLSPRHTVYDDGSGTPTCGASPYDAGYILQNNAFWLPNYGPEASLPATCTANDHTYYGTTDTDKIYKCTSMNTWTVYYTPYTYPHPLRADLPAPANLRIMP
jgi:hypothetical protein